MNSSPHSVRRYTSCGYNIILRQLIIAQRTATFDVSLEERSKIPEQYILTEEAKPPVQFEMKEPSTIVEPGKEEENAIAWQKYREAKKRFEAMHVDDEPMLKVTALIPVHINKQVLMDGRDVKIFHTLRGPIMGIVINEDLNRAYLHSPCFIDPNIEKGRIHYLPIAFAGFEFVLCKTNMLGESIPQEAEIEGYPYFVKRNQEGDYVFRMKAAYHHIDADLPSDAQLISATNEPRDALMGLIATSDTQESALVKGARKVEEIKKQQN